MSERIVATEAYQLLQRDFKKYIPNVLGLYGFSLIDLKRAHLARSSYFFFRRLDDVLDGDRTSLNGAPNPVECALHYRKQIETGRFDQNDPVAILAQGSLHGYEKCLKPGDDPRKDYLGVIDAMLLESALRENRTVMSEEEIRHYHHVLFGPIINLTCMGLESDIRSGDIPQLWEALGRTYSIRDLADDWPQGIINIPEHILDQAGLTGQHDYADVVAHPIIGNWIQQELEISGALLASLRQEVAQLSDSEPLLMRLLLHNRMNRMQKIIERHRFS